MEEALKATDPIDGAVSLAAAELVQQWHNTSPIVTGCAENASRTRVPWAVPMEFEALKQRLKIVECLMGMWRERRK